jgi:hypothetical protein
METMECPPLSAAERERIATGMELVAIQLEHNRLDADDLESSLVDLEQLLGIDGN